MFLRFRSKWLNEHVLVIHSKTYSIWEIAENDRMVIDTPLSYYYLRQYCYWVPNSLRWLALQLPYDGVRTTFEKLRGVHEQMTSIPTSESRSERPLHAADHAQTNRWDLTKMMFDQHWALLAKIFLALAIGSLHVIVPCEPTALDAMKSLVQSRFETFTKVSL